MEKERNLNSIMDIEGIRDFFNAQVYGKVYHYIRENHIPLNADNELVRLALEILKKADSLPSIYLKCEMEEEERTRELNRVIEETYSLLYKAFDLMGEQGEVTDPLYDSL